MNIDIYFNQDASDTNNYKAIFGGREGSRGKGFTYFNVVNGDTYHKIFQRNGESIPGLQNNYMGVDTRVYTNGNTLTVTDGTNTETITNNNTFTGGTASLYLFANNAKDKSYVDSPAKMKLYSCKLYDGETLIRDYIPVLDNNDVACLYDKVTGQFLYNKGSGEFIQGPVVPEPSPEPELTPTPVALDSVDF